MRWFDRVEGHFEAINGGRHITFENVLQPRPHPLVPCTESSHPCDVCDAPHTNFTCSYRDCPSRMWICPRREYPSAVIVWNLPVFPPIYGKFFCPPRPPSISPGGPGQGFQFLRKFCKNKRVGKYGLRIAEKIFQKKR